MIEWAKFYEKEAEFKRFIPEENPDESLRTCLVMSLAPKRIESVLDVGCGDGYLCSLFKSRGVTRVAGVDLVESRINYAKAHFQGIEFKAAEITKLPFDDGSFDLVTCVEVLEHLENPSAALKELKRVSRKLVLFTVPNNEPVENVVCPHCLKTFPREGHIQSFSPESAVAFCRDNGLVVEKIEISKLLDQGKIFTALFRPIIKKLFARYFKRGGYLGILCKVAK